jgi:7-cyano-7-deazaguanine synthase
VPTAIALLSGGLDSGTGLAMWLAREDHAVELCVTFDYGQRSAAAEHRHAARLAGRFGLPSQRLELPWLRDAARRAGSALVPGGVGQGGDITGGGDLPSAGTADAPGDAASAAAVWVPARNLVFLAIAASLAEAAGAGFVLAGFNREEAETFPDNSAPFVAAVDEALRFGTRSRVRICSPTIEMEKVGIVAEARRQGMTESDFWSCYRSGPEPCGTCESCVRSRRAWTAGDGEN